MNRHSKAFKKLLQPFGSHSGHKHHDSPSSSLKQTKQLSSSTVEISLFGSSKNSNPSSDTPNSYKQKAQQPSALKKLLSTSQELFHSKSKQPSNSHPPSQQPTLQSIGAVSGSQQNTSRLSPSTSGSKVRTDRPRSSHENYTDLQTVPEDYKSAFQQVFSKKPKILSSKQLLDKRHNRSKSLSQNICSSSTDSEDEMIIPGTLIKSHIDDEPIHMTLEEVRAMMAHGKGQKNEELSKGSEMNKKSKLKQAFQHLLHKTHCITNPTAISLHSPSTSSAMNSSDKSDNNRQSSSSIEQDDDLDYRADLSFECIPSTSSAPQPVSPFGQRALPPVPKRRDSKSSKQATTTDSNVKEESSKKAKQVARPTRNMDPFTSYQMKHLSLDQREQRKKEKYLMYLESISRVKQVSDCFT